MRVGASSIAGITAAIVTVVASLSISGQKPAEQSAPRLPMGKPEDVGMSSQRLARIGTVMQRYSDRKEIAGAVTLVARRGRVVYMAAVGDRDVEKGIRMTPDTIFRIRSMTKPIVTAAAMMLYEDGHFLLSDPVSKWLPEFRTMRVIDIPLTQQGTGMKYGTQPAANAITIRHLLTHTSGLPSYANVVAEFEKSRPQAMPNDTLASFADRVSKLPLKFEPGSSFHYSLATDVVGRLVEVISGRTLDQFLTDRIFQPLAMHDTHFYLPKNKLHRLAAVYGRNAQARIELTEAANESSPYVQTDTYFSAAGGLVSTAADVFRFHQMMLNGGELDGVRLLGRKTVELITANHTSDLFRMAPGMYFGLGYAVVNDVGASGLPGSVGMYTWPGSLTTTSFVDPAEDMVAVLMIQLQPRSSEITNEFQVLAYQAIVDGRATEGDRILTNP